MDAYFQVEDIERAGGSMLRTKKKSGRCLLYLHLSSLGLELLVEKISVIMFEISKSESLP